MDPADFMEPADFMTPLASQAPRELDPADFMEPEDSHSEDWKTNTVSTLARIEGHPVLGDCRR